MVPRLVSIYKLLKKEYIASVVDSKRKPNHPKILTSVNLQFLDEALAVNHEGTVSKLQDMLKQIMASAKGIYLLHKTHAEA